ncbi:hypothetical protein BDZ94DRAFT_1326634 [Collybia nuda]|uniref:Uncharacterized protein n=1 Tax=Collybia nuda TaxID=64659 RepID=A0A9P5XUE4_9AGAR|nr:hypothetical protein BDZ94DRAFT_1326634 [Collybia nuda]
MTPNFLHRNSETLNPSLILSSLLLNDTETENAPVQSQLFFHPDAEQNQVSPVTIDCPTAVITYECNDSGEEPQNCEKSCLASPLASGLVWTSADTSRRPCDSSNTSPSCMQSKSRNMKTHYEELSSRFPAEGLESFPGLPNSSPPPESSSPFPQSSSPPEYSSSPVFLNTLPTIYEEEPAIDPALLNVNYKDSPDSPRSETTNSDGSDSSQSSETSESTSSNSDTSISSPARAHIISLPPDRNDAFSNQLHRRLLAVIEEQKSEEYLKIKENGAIMAAKPGPCYSDVLMDFERTTEAGTTKNPPYWTRSTISNNTHERGTGPLNGRQNICSRTSSGGYLSRTSSRISATDPVPLTDDHYDSSVSNVHTEKLIFASPSPFQKHAPKRRRSLSPSKLRPLKLQFRLPEAGSSLTSSSPVVEDDTPTPKAPAPTYRIIQCASSFLASRRKVTEDSEEPPNKRTKTNSNQSTRRTEFAKGPASLRRAASLRSETGTNEKSHTPAPGLVPTAPCTPQEGSPIVDNSLTRQRFCREQKVKYPFPAVFPPIDYIPRLPISTETSAKVRLQRLIEREKEGRQQDGLWAVNLGREPPNTTNNDFGSTEEVTDGETDEEEDSNSGSIWDSVLGIGEVLRDDVVDWILNVLPEPTTTSRARSVPTSSSASTASSSSSTNSFSTISSIIGPTISNLYDQLSTSPETRFHAAYLFLRYFYLVRATPGSPSLNIDKGDENSENGFELVTWDVAVGCLALSVKYHRDFLDPLLPVYAHEFQELSPHGISYEDLESSQRDLLSAFSFSLGITPQGILDELWLALPSLRQLFNFTGGWNCVLKETWWRLFEAILEPDVLRFPVSLLTIGTLAGAIVESLMLKYEYDAGWRAEVIRRRKPGYVSAYATKSALQLRRKREKRATYEAEGVIQDIQAVLGITSSRLEDCRKWLLS